MYTGPISDPETFIFGSGWCRGLWNTPRRDPKEFRIIRVLISVPLNIGLPVDRHLHAGRQRTTRQIQMQEEI